MKRPQTISYIKINYVSKVYIQDQHKKEIKFEEHHSTSDFTHTDGHEKTEVL